MELMTDQSSKPLAKLISLSGTPFALQHDLAEQICLFSNGKMYVAHDAMDSPQVRSFHARASLLLPSQVVVMVPASLQEIREMYNGGASKVFARNAGDLSKRQKASLDIISEAVEAKASDIHIRCEEAHTIIFFRINNDLVPIHQMPSQIGQEMLAATYNTLCSESAEVYKPNVRQDARISDPKILPEGLFGIRIATTPTTDGPLMVMRLLYNAAGDDIELTALGYSESAAASVTIMKAQPCGVNIISGPTGSGKSTTLQRILVSVHRENDGTLHIITVEQPPEYPIEGAKQTGVRGETREEQAAEWVASIRAAMRLDPDVIMVGEMRDQDSAQTAFQAAMTGHQVWTTLHANNAIAILDRLADLGIRETLLTDPTLMTGLIAQRLVKTLCPHCKIAVTTDRFKKLAAKYSDVLARARMALQSEDLEGVYVRNPPGCEQCRKTGTGGRTVVCEAINPDEEFFRLIRKNKRPEAVDYWINSLGGQTMLMHSVTKIRAGVLDPLETEKKVGPLAKLTVHKHRAGELTREE